MSLDKPSSRTSVAKKPVARKPVAKKAVAMPPTTISEAIETEQIVTTTEERA